MTAPYFTGDGVPLKFTVSDVNGAVNPTSCAVHILKPQNIYIPDAEAVVDSNEVSYNVPGSMTDVAGLYKVYFVMTLPSGLERTHRMEFTVRSNPD